MPNFESFDPSSVKDTSSVSARMGDKQVSGASSQIFCDSRDNSSKDWKDISKATDNLGCLPQLHISIDKKTDIDGHKHVKCDADNSSSLKLGEKVAKGVHRVDSANRIENSYEKTVSSSTEIEDRKDIKGAGTGTGSGTGAGAGGGKVSGEAIIGTAKFGS